MPTDLEAARLLRATTTRVSSPEPAFIAPNFPLTVPFAALNKEDFYDTALYAASDV